MLGGIAHEITAIRSLLVLLHVFLYQLLVSRSISTLMLLEYSFTTCPSLSRTVNVKLLFFPLGTSMSSTEQLVRSMAGVVGRSGDFDGDLLEVRL